jgi:hypothetical protein
MLLEDPETPINVLPRILILPVNPFKRVTAFAAVA